MKLLISMFKKVGSQIVQQCVFHTLIYPKHRINKIRCQKDTRGFKLLVYLGTPSHENLHFSGATI